MPRGGARRGAGRKAPDQPKEPLLTYSLTLRPTDVGYLNKMGRGNLSLGLRRLIDNARIHLPPPAMTPVAADPSSSPLRSTPSPLRRGGTVAIPGQQKGTRQYG